MTVSQTGNNQRNDLSVSPWCLYLGTASVSSCIPTMVGSKGVRVVRRIPSVSAPSNRGTFQLHSGNFFKAGKHFISNIKPYMQCPTHETNMNEVSLVKWGAEDPSILLTPLILHRAGEVALILNTSKHTSKYNAENPNPNAQILLLRFGVVSCGWQRVLCCVLATLALLILAVCLESECYQEWAVGSYEGLNPCQFT